MIKKNIYKSGVFFVTTLILATVFSVSAQIKIFEDH